MKTATVEQHQQVLYELLSEFDRICRLHKIPYTLYAGTALGAVRHQGFIPWDDDADVLMLREDYDRFLAIAPGELDSKFFLQAEYSEHWPMGSSKLRKNDTACIEKFHPKDPAMHQGIYMDIFPCDNASDSPFIRKLQFLASRIVIAKGLDARGYETDSKLKKLFMAFCGILPMAPFRAFAQQRKNKKSAMVHGFFGSTRSEKKSVFPREWFTRHQDIRFRDQMMKITTHYDAMLSTLYGDYMKLPEEKDRVCKVHAILVDTQNSYTQYEHYRDGMEFDVYTRSIR